MKNLVVYFSRKGSNAYLAAKIAESLSCDMEAIRPRLGSVGLVLFNLNAGIRKMKHKVSDYDRVILVGPIFMGRFIAPLKAFVKRYKWHIKELAFVTCCGSTYAKKDEKFGHGLVFEKLRTIVNGKLTLTRAFPVGLLLPEDQREDPDAFMKAHLNDSTFKGEIAERFEECLEALR